MNRLNQHNKESDFTSGYFGNQKLSYLGRQKGITAIGMVIILALVAFFALLTLRLVPIYMENFTVSSHLNTLAEDSETKSLSDRDILSTLKKRFYIDDVKNVTEDNIFIDHEGGKTTITIEYEVRAPIFGNIDVAVSVNEEAVVK